LQWAINRRAPKRVDDSSLCLIIKVLIKSVGSFFSTVG